MQDLSKSYRKHVGPTRWRCISLFLAALTTLAGVLPAQPPQLPLVPGEAVATCFSGADSSGTGHVVGVYDIRDPSTAPGLNTNWSAPIYQHPDWTRDKLGEVFGVALDEAANPNIYVTSAFVYNRPGIVTQGPATGRVFKLDGVTGAVSVFSTLPNQGEGLGNIAYDREHDQFFVTNFHDGLIYRLDSVGTPQDTLAPFGALAAPVPVAKRVWGVGVHEDRVYFGTWSPAEVHSIALDSNGEFFGVVQLEATGFSMPVADIAFSSDGEMLVAERTMQGANASAHNARVLEFSGSSATSASLPTC